jgi:hypothetical protein
MNTKFHVGQIVKHGKFCPRDLYLHELHKTHENAYSLILPLMFDIRENLLSDI